MTHQTERDVIDAPAMLEVPQSSGGVAQLVEHLTGSQKVVGSSPITSTKVSV